MRKLILCLAALGLGLSLTPAAKALDTAAFFKGVRLGERLEEIAAYYKPYRKEVEFMGHGGALLGEQDFDLRPGVVKSALSDRRIYFSVDASDKRVVYVRYWKMGDNDLFAETEIARLKPVPSRR